MTDIPNTEYITVNKDGIFVGGKPAKKYRGQEIYDIDYVKLVFEWMQAQHANIAEFQIMSSKTRGVYAETGNLSAEHGPNAWCRIVLNDSSAAPWGFNYTYGSAADCAHRCAYYCAYNIRLNTDFRRAVLGVAAIDTRNANGGTGRQATSVAQGTPTVSPVTAPLAKIGDEFVIKLPNLNAQIRMKLEELQR
jgi:hypothetical protein